MVDHSQMKLGKLPAEHSPETKYLAAYMTAESINVPATVTDYTDISHWPMMANDRVGDCTIASAGHCIQKWTHLAQSKEVDLSDAVILQMYSAITGYNPRDPNTDRGAVERNVLSYWKWHGIGGHKINNYLAVEVSQINQLKLCVYLFDVCYIGVALPITAQNQDIWAESVGPNAAPGSWGGHAVPVVGYNAIGPVVITWGEVKQMTWGFWSKYVEEAWAVLSTDWVNKQNIAPNHLTWNELVQDLSTNFKS